MIIDMIIDPCPHSSLTWWRHQMETFSALLPFVRGIHRSSDAELWCFLDLRLNKRLSKQSWGWWFESPSRLLWRHCYVSWSHVSVLSTKRHRRAHDDVIKWKHFPRCWPFVRRIHRSPVNSPHKGQWRGALMFSLICTWINSWVNNPEAGDLRRHRAHYDVSVMMCLFRRIFTSLLRQTHSAAYVRQWIGSELVKIMACRLFGAKPLSKPMLGYCQLDC